MIRFFYLNFLIPQFYVCHANLYKNCNYIYEVNSNVRYFINNVNIAKNNVSNVNNHGIWRYYLNITSALDDVSRFKNKQTCILIREDQVLGYNQKLIYHNGLSIIGVKRNISITCLKDAALHFYKSENIILKNLIIKGCGGRVQDVCLGWKETNKIASSAILLLNVRNIKIVNVVVSNSVGFAMVLMNVSSEVYFYQLTIQNNSRVFNSENNFSSGGGIFIYQHALEKYEKAFINIKRCSFYLNQNERNRYTLLNEDNLYSVGAGLTVFFGESAKNNELLIRSSSFKKNEGLYGGGLLLYFVKNSKNNKVQILNSNFTKNKAKLQGGGLMTYIQTVFSNLVEISGCNFFKNAAKFGGALSHYSEVNFVRTLSQYHMFNFFGFLRYYNERKKKKIIINNCKILKNYGEIGVGMYAENVFLQLSFISLSESSIPWDNPRVIGQGALFSYYSTIKLKDENVFNSNNITAITLVSSKITVEGNLQVANNNGMEGGAISMYQSSILDTHHGTKMSFLNNSALTYGGAIFVKSEQQYLLDLAGNFERKCFMKIKQSSIVNFKNNTSKIGGKNDIFTSTLNSCNKIYNKTNFDQYFNTTNIETDSIKITINNIDWKGVYPGQLLKPSVLLTDELNNTVYSSIEITIDNQIVYSGLNSNIGFYMKGKTNHTYNVSIQSRYVATKFNISTNFCPFAYSYKNDICFCNKKINIAKGLLCNSNGSISIYCGFYTNTSQVEMSTDNDEVTQMCPFGYCFNCIGSRLLYTSPDNNNQCNTNRTGYLCSKCVSNTVLMFGSETCGECNTPKVWIILFFILVPFCAVFIFAIFLNICIYESWLNSTIYFYQLLQYVDREIVDSDKVLTFIVGVLTMSKIKHNIFSICLLKNWNNLDKLAIEYIIPVSMFISLFICGICLKRPLLYLGNLLYKNNTHLLKVLPLILILTYADILRISFLLLQPVDYSGNNPFRPYMYASITYGESRHAFYIALAIFFLLLLVGFPLILLSQFRLNRWFSPGLIDAFRGKFKNNSIRKGFASFFFFARIITIGLGTLITNRVEMHTTITLFSVILLVVFTSALPFNSFALNFFDSFVLFLLTLLSIIKSGNLGHQIMPYKEYLEDIILILSYSPAILAILRCLYLLYNSYNRTKIYYRVVNILISTVSEDWERFARYSEFKDDLNPVNPIVPVGAIIPVDAIISQINENDVKLKMKLFLTKLYKQHPNDYEAYIKKSLIKMGRNDVLQDLSIMDRYYQQEEVLANQNSDNN